MFLLFSHTLTQIQKKDAFDKFDIDEFVMLPKALQGKWSNVPPENDIPDDYLDSIVEFLLDNQARKNYVLIEGEYGLVYNMVRWCMKNKFIPVYATTKRVYKSVVENYGEVVKGTHTFKHVTFRIFRGII